MGTEGTERRERLALRPSEAAEAIGVCRQTVYALVRRGELPVLRIGTAVRIPTESLRQWIRTKALENRAEVEPTPS
jgi:excisionase family DNA binding protein